MPLEVAGCLINVTMSRNLCACHTTTVVVLRRRTVCVPAIFVLQVRPVLFIVKVLMLNVFIVVLLCLSHILIIREKKGNELIHINVTYLKLTFIVAEEDPD